MCAIHLDMVELERDRQGRGEPFLTIFPPHHHWITECVSVLINNAVEFSLNHCGSTNVGGVPHLAGSVGVINLEMAFIGCCPSSNDKLGIVGVGGRRFGFGA